MYARKSRPEGQAVPAPPLCHCCLPSSAEERPASHLQLLSCTFFDEMPRITPKSCGMHVWGVLLSGRLRNNGEREAIQASALFRS